MTRLLPTLLAVLLLAAPALAAPPVPPEHYPLSQKHVEQFLSVSTGLVKKAEADPTFKARLEAHREGNSHTVAVGRGGTMTTHANWNTTAKDLPEVRALITSAGAEPAEFDKVYLAVVAAVMVKQMAPFMKGAETRAALDKGTTPSNLKLVTANAATVEPAMKALQDTFGKKKKKRTTEEE